MEKWGTDAKPRPGQRFRSPIEVERVWGKGAEFVDKARIASRTCPESTSSTAYQRPVPVLPTIQILVQTPHTRPENRIGGHVRLDLIHGMDDGRVVTTTEQLPDVGIRHV